MPLRLVVGPPSSGRTGEIMSRLQDFSQRDPILVVPTVDDVERFEQELTGAGSSVVGTLVCTFDNLFGLVARATGTPGGPALSRPQRRRIAREAVSTTGLRVLAASSRQSGFAAALGDLIAELQAASVDAATFKARAGEAGAYEHELAALYEAYTRIRDELGRHDDHSLASAASSALRASPEAWASRPVFFYGFDDLTVEQLELVRELAQTTEVTFALPWEDREVLTAARGALFAELRDFEGADVTVLEAEPRFTSSGTLFELARRFGKPPEEVGDPLENDGGLALLCSGGELAEAEAIGAEIARLLHDGVPAGKIAIVVRDPASAAPLYRSVLERFEIPVAAQADLPATRTATGRGLIALLEAAVGRGRAADLLSYLRMPGISSPSRVDWFERRLARGRMRSADEALEAWDPDGERPLQEIERLRAAVKGGELLGEAGRQARWLAESALRRQGAVAGEDRALELRAGAEVERSLAELADLGLPHDPAQVIAAVAAVEVPMWRGPSAGRVRVISPYRARARRVRHMFVASLQDGDFPRRDTGGPLLSDDTRAGLGLPPRTKAEAEDRYLFSVCLSRPTERLWLSWRNADDEGRAAARSPFIDETRDLLHPPLPAAVSERDEALAAEASGRELAESVFAIADAPSPVELARAEAALAPAPPDEERLRPGPLTFEPVRDRMRAMDLFGPSTLEKYAECPYRWFVDHELEPQRIGPEDEALNAGQVAHGVLEALYEKPPGDTARPEPASLEVWQARARELIEEIGPEQLPRERPDTAAALRRVEGIVLAFLADESRAPSSYTPKYTEASFGFEDADKGPLPLAGAGIHGRIDRIDLGPGGEALVQDYKSGARVAGGKAMVERGKLQLQLYLLAARELWGLDLAGGVYRPLGGTTDRQPKGVLRKAVRDDLESLDPRPRDHLEDDVFEAALEEAQVEAERIIEAIHRGDIGRRPLNGRCPDYCHYQPICRRERGLPEEEPKPDFENEEEQ